MKYLLLALIIRISCPCCAQAPDNMKVYINDTVRNMEDCVIKVTISKKNDKKFIFPAKFRVSTDDDATADIVLQLEKETGKIYTNYLCEWASAHFDSFIGDSIIYQFYTKIEIIDSLKSLKCVSKGKYRLKVSYSKRPTNGTIGPKNYVLDSKWLYFYVAAKEITLKRYYYNKNTQQ